jgi:hypothetical protein
MAGTWQALANQPPFAASTMLLLTDGTVMAQSAGGRDWWKLTPDASGDFVKGTWSQLASMAHSRLYYGSAVLQDGRVIVMGGEYSDGGSEFNGVEIYDPALDSWTSIPGPGWGNIGDSVTCVLADGRLLLGNIFANSTAIFDPVTEAWSAGPIKDDASDEETWTLAPDGTVLTVECTNIPKAEKYVPASNSWVSAGSTPVPIAEATMSEIGPALLLPDGRIFCVGGTGHTALYTPPANPASPGAWTQGPDFPESPPGSGQLMKANDAPGCLLPNGKVLCTAGPAGATGFASPTYFFEYDPAANTLAAVPNPGNAGGVVFAGRMTLVPTGQVLFAAGSPHVEVYTPSGGPQPSWKPTITSYPKQIEAGLSYTLTGHQLNGLSQAVSYGDDAQGATNYPLVRLTYPTGKVVYTTTFDHSSMGVATGATLQSTNFFVPWSAPKGNAELCLVANGISSDCVKVHVRPHRIRIPHYEAWNWLIGSLADGPLWVIGRNGPHPIGPWNGRLAERAKEANAMIGRGIQELEVLGKEVEALRAAAEHEAIPTRPSGERHRKAKVKTKA